MPKLNLREPAGRGRAVVETVMRALPKAAAVHHHRALHFSDVAEALWRETGRRTWTAAPVSAWSGRPARHDPPCPRPPGRSSGKSGVPVGRPK